MTADPRLSIGFPVHNGEQYLAEALDALLDQSYEDFEVIVSDTLSVTVDAVVAGRERRAP